MKNVGRGLNRGRRYWYTPRLSHGTHPFLSAVDYTLPLTLYSSRLSLRLVHMTALQLYFGRQYNYCKVGAVKLPMCFLALPCLSQ